MEPIQLGGRRLPMMYAQGERLCPPQKSRRLVYWVKTGVVVYANRPTEATQCLLAVAAVSRELIMLELHEAGRACL